MASSDQTRDDLSDPAAIATELAGEAAADGAGDTAKGPAERARYQKYLLEHFARPGRRGEPLGSRPAD